MRSTRNYNWVIRHVKGGQVNFPLSSLVHCDICNQLPGNLHLFLVSGSGVNWRAELVSIITSQHRRSKNIKLSHYCPSCPAAPTCSSIKDNCFAFFSSPLTHFPILARTFPLNPSITNLSLYIETRSHSLCNFSSSPINNFPWSNLAHPEVNWSLYQ